jgi:hypothetical protein
MLGQKLQNVCKSKRVSSIGSAFQNLRLSDSILYQLKKELVELDRWVMPMCQLIKDVTEDLYILLGELELSLWFDSNVLWSNVLVSIVVKPSVGYIGVECVGTFVLNDAVACFVFL